MILQEEPIIPLNDQNPKSKHIVEENKFLAAPRLECWI